MSEVITTAEELDALPVGSVVRGDNSKPWVREYKAFTLVPTWHTVRSHGDYEATAAGLLPATILYRPDTPAPSDEDREASSILSAADRFVGGDPVDDMAILLMRAWGEAAPGSSVSQHSTSYVATFVDMARAVLAARSPQPAPSVSAEQAWDEMRTVIDEALDDYLGDTFTGAVTDGLATLLHERILAARTPQAVTTVNAERVKSLVEVMHTARYPEGFWVQGYSDPPEADDETVVRAILKALDIGMTP